MNTSTSNPGDSGFNSCLKGLKDRLATSNGPEAAERREKVEAVESRIEELPECKAGRQYHTQSGAE